jgi:hypothetical protein
MPTTYVDYTATAAQTDFAFTFPYLEDEHVVVEIDGVQKTLTTDYTIVTSPSTKIVLTSGATAGQVVRVRRKSQPGTDLVDFENGSVLTESELDRAYLHNRYLNEEIGELNDASLQKEAGGTDWDAGGSKIKNVGAPTLTADATTKQYVDDKVNQLSSGASSPPTKWVFTGTAGANTTYSVTDAEVNGDTAYDVSVDGSVLEPTTDYTVDPDTDTLTIVSTLSGGEDIVVIERGFGVAITGTIGADQLQSNAVTTAKLADHSVTAVKISNTDSKFNVQTDGKVGISSQSPDSKLEIVDSSNHLNLKVADTVSQSVIKFSDSDGLAGAINYDHNTDKLHFITDGTATPFNGALNIDSSGNVGIGTAYPNLTGLQLGNALVVSSSTGGDIVAHKSGSSVNVGDICGALLISNSDTDGNEDHFVGMWGKVASTNGNQNLHFSAGREGYENDTPQMTIKGTEGHVGIGTVSPSAPLEVTSTTGGVVFPRLDSTQRDAISTPTDGETIFNTTTNQLESYNGTSWGAAGSGVVSKYDSGWSASTVSGGNTITVTHNLGTPATCITVLFSTSSNGSNAFTSDIAWDLSNNPYGASIRNIGTNSFDLQIGVMGLYILDTSGNDSGVTSAYWRAVVIG